MTVLAVAGWPGAAGGAERGPDHAGRLFVPPEVRRVEKISIQPDGTTRYLVDLTGPPGDLLGGDLLPAPEAGWVVVRDRTVRQAGRRVRQYAAAAKFAGFDLLPNRFGRPSDPGPDVFLFFPTVVTAERRAEGVYFHFHRSYVARQWAQFAYFMQREVDRPFADLLAQPVDDWHDEQRKAFVQAYVQAHGRVVAEVARAPFVVASGAVVQDAWLRTRQFVLDRYAAMDAAAIASAWSADLEVSERSPWSLLISRLDGLDVQVRADVRNWLAAGGMLSPQQVEAFDRVLQRELLRHRVTRALSSQRFEIEVTLPGEVVAANTEDVSGGTVRWRFAGEAFLDRIHDLQATARYVPASGERVYGVPAEADVPPATAPGTPARGRATEDEESGQEGASGRNQPREEGAAP